MTDTNADSRVELQVSTSKDVSRSEVIMQSA